MRFDGKCYWTSTRGGPKCYTYNDQVFRLCACADYEDLLGRIPGGVDLHVGLEEAGKPTEQGWYMVSQRTCDDYCGDGGLVCDDGPDSILNAFRGADMMEDLEEAFGGGICDQWDDRIDKAMNPSYRDTGHTCYVNKPDSEGKAACNIKARSAADWRWCYCQDSA